MSSAWRIAFSLILALPSKNVKASSVAAIILVEYEKKLLANQYLGDVEKQYQASIPKADQPITPDTLEDYGNHSNIEDVESREDIDPNARLFQTFDSITQKEQERLGRNVDIQATNKLIIDSITSIPT